MRHILIFIIMSLFLSQSWAWDVDFSRRQKKPVAPDSLDANSPNRNPASSEPAQLDVKTELPAPPLTSETTIETNQAEVPSTSKVPSRLESLFKRAASPTINDRQEFVILNTSQGFIPSNVRLRKGLHYTVHVVNVNEDKKNVSFMLDAFGQHHATYFGKIKTFDLDPNVEGIFEFQCPETSSQGKLVIFGNQPKLDRHLSSTP